MKVSKCGGEQTTPKELTWDEMILSEGVYRSTGSSGTSSRFVVVTNFGQPNTVLWFCDGMLETAGGEWKRGKFIPTNETVCFELKPA